MFKNLNAKIKVKFFSQYSQKCDQQGVNTILLSQLLYSVITWMSLFTKVAPCTWANGKISDKS